MVIFGVLVPVSTVVLGAATGIASAAGGWLFHHLFGRQRSLEDRVTELENK